MPTNWLNPAAGDVPLPSDPLEVEAALRAGRVTWRLLPYLGWRYGERGAAFTRSDSAWLVTLSRMDQRAVLEQVEWLGSVLSNRGMPRWLLEIHLEVLYRELMRAFPASESGYEKLLAASLALGDSRRQSIAEEAFERLAAEFAVSVGAPTNRWVVGTGRLIVAAVADEKSGILRAVESLESWLTDPARYDEARRDDLRPHLKDLLDATTFEGWVQSVRATIDAARKA